MCNTLDSKSELWLRPCLSAVTVQELSRRRVSFADAVPGKSLTAVKEFCKHDPPSFCGNAPHLHVRKLEHPSRTQRSTSCSEQQLSENTFTRGVTLTILTRPSGRDNAVISLGFARYDERLNAITGSFSVKNWQYEKDAFVRYTTDHWCTFQDVRSSYSWSRSSGTVDIFTFVLLLPSSLMIVGMEVEFALSVNMGGTSYWDNNEGKNFKATVECAWVPPPWPHVHSRSRFAADVPTRSTPPNPTIGTKQEHRSSVAGVQLTALSSPYTSSEEDGLWEYMDQRHSAASWSLGCLPAGNLDDQVNPSLGSYDEFHMAPTVDLEQNSDGYSSYGSSFFSVPSQSGHLVNAG
eukprot:comp22338_c0_seq1/m.33222 comp22338_c0_seq1/g.33222  ORF comp22338_c0_seq1/g.33222 comp22338_c0_seq1/m.33222 type:complete len:349 (-) comp22338_c0_seq1:265-1311(-)